MITMYTKDNCPFCLKAKAYLDKINEEYTEININEPGIRDWLIEQNHKTVPQFYFNGKILVEGGYAGLSSITIEELEERKNAIIKND